MARRHTILVVDDEPDVVQSVKDLLRLDYNVIGATRAADGLKLMEENEVDVVMSDQRMPEMTGVQFLSRVRSPHPEATRLLFTGYADIKAVIDAINQGNVYRYITKPWDPDELQTIIREACERHDLIVQRRLLMDELEKKNVALESANAELREADALKAAFIQVASHELRTPLAILQGYCDLAVREKEVSPSLKEWLARIEHATVRLRYLVNQIINMLQAGDFHAVLARQTVDVATLLREAVSDVEPFIELRHQQLTRDFPDDLGKMDLDAGKIRDAVNHLLLNAVKFTPDGGKIGVSARRLDDGGVEIVVSDTGRGLDEAALKRFGEKFFTSYDVAKHASGQYEFGRQGLGLGVSVVKAFIEMHGGTLSVESQVGRGTAVTIHLPAGNS